MGQDIMIINFLNSNKRWPYSTKYLDNTRCELFILQVHHNTLLPSHIMFCFYMSVELTTFALSFYAVVAVVAGSSCEESSFENKVEKGEKKILLTSILSIPRMCPTPVAIKPSTPQKTKHNHLIYRTFYRPVWTNVRVCPVENI